MVNSRIHRRKPKGKPLPEYMERANVAKSAIRAYGEQVHLLICIHKQLIYPSRAPLEKSHESRNCP